MSRRSRITRPDGRLEAFRTTGSSPGDRPHLPTLHLLGPGSVGRQVLRGLDPGTVRLVAVSDRGATLHDPAGLDPRRVAAWKDEHGPLADAPGASRGPAHRVLTRVGADLVVDTTSSLPGRDRWHDALELGVVARGRRLVLASKDPVAARAHRWLTDPTTSRIGVNAVLGGTGALFQSELPGLRETVRTVALAGNATTTVVLDLVERGASLEEGIDRAAGLGLLESDPELDLRGWDAAVKLAVVAGALLGCRVDPDGIATEDLREVDAGAVRARAREGSTTRLVGRLHADGRLTVRFEGVSRTSPLAVPHDRVAYLYGAAGGSRRLHVGDGLGAARTAAAVLSDVAHLLAGWPGRRT